MIRRLLGNNQQSTSGASWTKLNGHAISGHESKLIAFVDPTQVWTGGSLIQKAKLH
jgi:hypothetical protein